MSYLFTSESVSSGHPDKVADQISDAILDEFLKQDCESKVACETLCTTGLVVLAGEVKSNAYVDLQKVARGVINDIGYDKSEYQFDSKSCGVISTIHEQSSDINQGVEKEDVENQGAGDQGIMFGYATNETAVYMPATLSISHLILKTLEDIRKEGKVMTYLRPDSKSQVTIEYDDVTNEPLRIDTIVVSTQHDDWVEVNKIKNDVKSILIPRVIDKLKKNNDSCYKLFNDNYKLYVNPTGKFVIGGPHGDTGLTGRKIIVDTYGGRGAHGGGAFCVDGDTEYLTKDGWKKISNYNNEEVAQWDNGEISFVKPYYYHKHTAEKMYHIYTANGLDMVLSEHHNVVLKTSKGNIIKKITRDLLDEEGKNIRNGNNGFIPCYFNYEGGDGINLSDNEIRLQIAFCADGSIIDNGKKGRIRIKKDYKKKNLVELLNLCNIEYTVSDDGDDFLIYYFIPPIISKSLVSCFKNANKHQMKVIAKELPMWDGNCDNVFRTTIKEDADFAQYIFMSVYNTNASIIVDDRVGEKYKRNDKEYERKSILYEVSRLKYDKISFRKSTNKKSKNKIYVEEFIPLDGNMYCFSVPSTMLILRRNNHIFVTGNCGKDPSKVDRSAAYMARYLAKNIVAADIAKECCVQLSYAIGVAQPISVYVNTYGTNKIFEDDYEIAEWIKENVDLRPYAIIKKFELKNPIYKATASYGHFGRTPYTKDGVEYFAWEKLDMVDILRERFV